VRHDATDVQSLSEAEMISRQQIIEYVTWLREAVPGFEHSYLPSIGCTSACASRGA